MDWCDVLTLLETDVLRQNIALILFSEVGWVERLAFLNQLVVNLFLREAGVLSLRVGSTSWSLIGAN
jgi:predicted Rossmann-fold nucleotide-binding protein